MSFARGYAYNQGVMRTILAATALAASALAQTPPAGASERGWQVLEAALKAAGGRDKLEAVKDLSFQLQTRVIAPQGDFDIRSESRFVFPRTVRQESAMPFGEVSMAVNGDRGWMKGPKGLIELPPAELRRIEADLARGNFLFRPPKDPSQVRWAAEETVEGRLCDVIEIAGVGGVPLRLAVDRQSFDILKRSYRSEAPGSGTLGQVEEFLSDYREIEGLRLSFRVRVMRDGKLARDSVTRELRINSGLNAQELFRPPEG
jgi:hypothetical protein